MLSNEEKKEKKCQIIALARWLGGLKAPYTPKHCRFDSQSGHIPRLQVQSLVRVHTRGNQSMFLSHINVFLSPFLSL